MSAIVRGGGVEITADDLARAAKIGAAEELVKDLIFTQLAVQRAHTEGVALSDEERSAAIGEFFFERNAMAEEDMAAWIEGRGLERDQAFEWISAIALREKLIMCLVPDETLIARFNSTISDFVRIQAEVITFDSAGAASEIYLELREGEITWSEASRRALSAGTISSSRAELPDVAAGPLLGASPGDFIGPIETDEGPLAIYRFQAKIDPVFDGETEKKLRTTMAREIILRPLIDRPLKFVDQES